MKLCDYTPQPGHSLLQRRLGLAAAACCAALLTLREKGNFFINEINALDELNDGSLEALLGEHTPEALALVEQLKSIQNPLPDPEKTGAGSDAAPAAAGAASTPPPQVPTQPPAAVKKGGQGKAKP
jgi:hypothetical protein